MITKTQIVIADPFPVVRSGLRFALACFIIIGEAENGTQAMELCKLHNPDLIVADYQLPRLNAISLAKWLAKHSPKTKLLVLSYDKSEQATWACLRAGANGFVSKDQSINVILEAAQDVLSGKTVALPPLKNGIRVDREIDRLTDRQLEVLQLIAEGQSTKGAARIIKVSPKTVEYHRGRLMEILGIWDIPGLVRFASRNALISL